MRTECVYKRAIVRAPCRNMIHGITTAALGSPDFEKALIQHAQYVDALKECGLEVIELPPDERYPDSTFVEDTALLIPDCAVITNPGAFSRKGEIIEMKKYLADYFKNIENINPPGTVDGGDILEAGNHYYIGLSERTNAEGARQMIEILRRHGMTGSTLNVRNLLHLKSGIAYLGNKSVISNSLSGHGSAFKDFKIYRTGDGEDYAANCIRVNDQVIFPMGFPRTKNRLENSGFSLKEVDVSEFRKLDGGVSCLSLRF